ncbi:hypothetical protein [Pedobacter mucosus]|uniref:hypothetical protein n=1 Tax=Pedobacter mucosus TaxID=2895286 RepID=UPI001EE3DD8E|nr:hypothetical protein [Pedobacter mucosus]UKT65880.1 hypothetical protein LOK61_08825 [Pedobacter mucosus]
MLVILKHLSLRKDLKMDINIITLEIIRYITDFDYYNTLEALELNEKSSSYQKLLEIRERNKRHLTEFLPDVKIYDQAKKINAIGSFKQTLKAKMETLSKKEVEDYLNTLKKDAVKIAKIYKRVIKKSQEKQVKDFASL